MTKYDRNKYILISKSRDWFQPTPESIESWLQRNRIEYKKGGKGKSVRICNPDGDQNFSMAIYLDIAFVKDFRIHHAQFNGSFVRFVANYKNISIMEAIRDIGGNSKVVAGYQATDDIEEKNEDVISLPAGAKPLKGSSGQVRDIVMKYLTHDRAIRKDQIYKHNIHYLGTRMLFPYCQYEMIVFYQFRDLLNKRFEFPDAGVKSAGNYLWGFDNVEPCGQIIIVESIFNALSIGDNAVATGGASLKAGQLKLVKALNPKEIILAADNDGAGIKSIYHDFSELQKMKDGDFAKKIYYCLPPLQFNGVAMKDWNEMLKLDGDPSKWINDNKIELSNRILFEGIKAI